MAGGSKNKPEVTSDAKADLVSTAATKAEKSDRYRVKGPGGIFDGRRIRAAGTVVTLSESDALSLMDHIEPLVQL